MYVLTLEPINVILLGVFTKYQFFFFWSKLHLQVKLNSGSIGQIIPDYQGWP